MTDYDGGECICYNTFMTYIQLFI